MSHLPGVLFFWKDPERPIDMILLQSDQSKSFVRPLVTVGFISLLASQSKPAIMDPISVQRYSVLAVKGNEQEPVKFNTQGSGFHQVYSAFTVYANDSESEPYPE
ncbi:hypothetical protein F4703DRAFT_1937414 [Phycomyces blakesleeanus]